MDVLHDDLHPQDDHSHNFFIWPEWIAANGPLTTPDAAFEYFTTSMFYDKQSNNQVLRMQTIHSGLPLVNESDELKRFTGIEFALVHALPPSLFIIHKRDRLSPDQVRPLTAYFIIHNRIYQSPDLYTVLSNRLLTTVHSLQSSLTTLRSYRPEYTQRTGFVWPIVESTDSADNAKGVTTSDAPAESPAATTKPSTESRPGNVRKQENLSLMLNAMRTTSAHLKTSFTVRSDDALATMDASESISQSSAVPRNDTPLTAAPPSTAAESVNRSSTTTKRRKKSL